jgi:signal transduction histidine kinase/ActR/RegA family two-component response regulator
MTTHAKPAEEHDFFKAMFENNSIPMSVWKWMDKSDSNSFVSTHLNKAACEARQKKPTEVIGRSMNESQFFNSDVSDAFCEAIRSDIPVTAGKFPYVHSRPERTYLVSAFPIFHDSVVALFEDVTDLEEAERKLALEKKEKEEALQAKATLLARVSHELRSPLNGIIGCTELLMVEPEHQRDYINTIQQCSISLLNLINDLLDYSKASAGKLELQQQTMVLHQVIESSLNVISLQAAQKKLHLGYILGADVPFAILGDASRLQQVLTNLLSNSVKFTDEGEILLTVDVTSQNRLLFSVNDTGIGIPKEKVKCLFQEYGQVNSSNGRAFGGTGLGLVICRQLISLMDGEIWVESKDGIGTTFFFTLPLHPSLTTPNYKDMKHLVVLILSKSESIALQLKSHLCMWNIPVVWHNTTDESSLPSGYLSQFNIVFWDFTSCTKQLHHDGKLTEDTIELQRSSAETPFVVAIVAKDFTPNQGEYAGSLRLPIKRDTIERIISFKGNKTKLIPNEPWLNYGDDHPLTILLVDDNRISIKVATCMLNRMGYRNLDIAVDGEEAVKLAQKSSYDLILMDIQMPVMDGIEATREIRKENKSTYICALSAGESKQSCMDAGMDNSLLKPITMQNLFEVIENAYFHVITNINKRAH